MEFRKHIKLELSDYISYNYYTMGKMLILFPALIVVLVILFVANDIDATTTLPGMLIKIGAAIVITVLASFLFVILLKGNLKKVFLSNKMMQVPNEYLLDETGVHVSNEFGNSSIPWQSIVKAAESKNACYVFIAKNQAFILPKRLIGASEQQELQTLLKRHLPPEKIRFSKRG